MAGSGARRSATERIKQGIVGDATQLIQGLHLWLSSAALAGLKV